MMNDHHTIFISMMVIRAIAFKANILSIKLVYTIFKEIVPDFENDLYINEIIIYRIWN